MAKEAKGAKTVAANTTPKKNPAEHLAAYKWQPGVAPNPNGRPKGSRNKLGEAFLEDMLSAWTVSGKDAIERVIAERPHEFIKAVAGILPKEMEIKTTSLQELSDDDLAAALLALRSATSLANVGSGSETKARH